MQVSSSQLQSILKNKPSLLWYSALDQISDKSALEAILNYGDWTDFLNAKNALGYDRAKNLYADIRSTKRQNLKTKTVNYFDLYFHFKNA